MRDATVTTVQDSDRERTGTYLATNSPDKIRWAEVYPPLDEVREQEIDRPNARHN